MTPQQDAQEPVAWRELCRRLYVEMFYCDQQMTSGKSPKRQQGKTVRDVLALSGARWGDVRLSQSLVVRNSFSCC